MLVITILWPLATIGSYGAAYGFTMATADPEMQQTGPSNFERVMRRELRDDVTYVELLAAERAQKCALLTTGLYAVAMIMLTVTWFATND
jgi:hypothetical protein